MTAPAPAIVAAGAGVFCRVISCRHIQDNDAGRVTVRDHLVVAWRVWPDDNAPCPGWHAEPILLSHVVTGCDLVLLPLPDGGWWLPFDGGVRAADDDLADLCRGVERAEAMEGDTP